MLSSRSYNHSLCLGCTHSEEQTRECYFEPLSNCIFSDADPIKNNKTSHVLNTNDEEYDRRVRTLYTTDTYFPRITKDTYSWTGFPAGSERSNISPEIVSVAASLAYYFRPQPWLQKEIHERLQKSIPWDLDPDKTIGVPLRRSDKCKGHNMAGLGDGHMDCPSLDKYYDAINEFLNFEPKIENIIVTSEDKAACDKFIGMLETIPRKIRLITHVGDVQQGTGSGSMLTKFKKDVTNESAVVR